MKLKRFTICWQFIIHPLGWNLFCQIYVNGTWYPMHVTTERHHLLSYCPDDVNIIDVLEMIVDCTLAGLTRSGTIRPVELNDEILKKAVDNTVQLIKNMVEVVDQEEVV